MKRLARRAAWRGRCAAMAAGAPAPAAAQDKCTIALIPGLTTDAFYITMRKGAEMAAKAVGCELLFQGAPDFNPIAAGAGARGGDRAQAERDPDRAHRQAAADRSPAAGGRCRHPGDHRRHLHRRRQVPERRRRGDFPLSYIATDNVLGGFLAGLALAKQVDGKGKVYVSNVRPGISTTDQREEGFKAAMKNFPDITVLETQFNDNDANKAASQLQAVFARNTDLDGVFGANLFSALGAADGVKALGKSGADPGRRLRCADPDRRRSQVRPDRPRGRPASGRDRLLRRDDRLRRDPRPVGAAARSAPAPPIMTKNNIDDPEREEVRLQRLIDPAPVISGAQPSSPHPLERRHPARSPPSPFLTRRLVVAVLGCSCCSVFFETWARPAYGVSFLLNSYNLQSIAISAAMPLLLGLGQTFVIIAGGIDLSVGFVMGLRRGDHGADHADADAGRRRPGAGGGPARRILAALRARVRSTAR